MRKLIVVSLVFELLACAGVALLIYTAQPSGSAVTSHVGAPYSLQEDAARTSQRLDMALEKVRLGILTMLAVSMAAQIGFLALGKPAERAR